MKNLIRLNKIFIFSFLFLTVNFANSMGQKTYASPEKILEEIKNNLEIHLNYISNIYVEPINSNDKIKLYKVKIEVNHSFGFLPIAKCLNEKNEYPFSHLEIISENKNGKSHNIKQSDIKKIFDIFDTIKSKGLESLIVLGIEIE